MMECVLCSEYWADEVEWVKDHTADKLVQCQVCTPCKYLIRDSPSHRKRWKAWHAKIQTPASTLALRERDQRRYNRALSHREKNHHSDAEKGCRGEKRSLEDAGPRRGRT